MISTAYLRNTVKGLYGAATASLLLGCATPIEDYAETRPLLTTDFFIGEMTAHGIVKDWKGKVIRHFNADLNGYREGSDVILDELFIFDDGEEQTRQWKFTNSDEHTFTGTAGDVIGPARGENEGNAMYMEYDIEVESTGQKLVLAARDALYLVNPYTLLSESTLYKFGLPVASITLVISKTRE